MDTEAGFRGESLEPVSLGRETVGDVVTALHRTLNRPRAQVIGVDWETSSFLIPAAGSVQGNFGTFFRTDVTLANRKSTAQIVSLAWMARGVNNGSETVQSFTIPANTTVTESDFVARILGKSGLGSIVVISRTSSGGIDTTAQIDGFSRIWSNQPGSSGTVSQNFPPVDIEDSLATSYGYGLRQDSQFRSNAGFVNFNSTPQAFTVAIVGINGSTSMTVTVQAFSMEQVAIPAGNWGDFYIRVSSGANFNWWSAYGTSVDNITGDGWVCAGARALPRTVVFRPRSIILPRDRFGGTRSPRGSGRRRSLRRDPHRSVFVVADPPAAEA